MPLSDKVLKGSATLLLIKLIQRGIGLISTLVLARLLTPEDFGIVAIATLILYFFDAISNTGVKEYLIQKKDLSDNDINTAWTLNVIVKTGIWIIFVSIVPLFSNYYSNPELTYVLWVISLMLPIGAISSIGLILFQKELNFRPIILVSLIERVTTFITIITLALILENYWAMVIGTISGYIVNFFVSYKIHDFRPKPTLINIKKQWLFSKWLILRGIFGYIKAEIDTLLVSKLFSIQTLGSYNLMKSLTGMVGRDIITPSIEPLLSSFSSVKNDREQLSFQLAISLWIILLITLPIISFSFTHHKLIILVLLGDQWIEYSDIFSVLTFLIFTFSLSGILNHFLTSLEKVKQIFYIEVFGFVLMASVLIGIDFTGIYEFSIYRTIIAIFLTFVLITYCSKLTSLSLIDLLILIIPALLSAVISSYVTTITQSFAPKNPVLELLVQGTIFVSLYLSLAVTGYYTMRQSKEVIYLKWVMSNITSKISGN